ncbi:hypothetical protein Tco_1530518 [Tanacetum coccineum]
MKCPQHYLTDMQEVILFYNGLEVLTRQIIDSKGAIPTKIATDAKIAIQEMAKYSQKSYNGTSKIRSTKTSDGLAAIQAQLNNLGREIKKVNEKVYAAQFCFFDIQLYQFITKGSVSSRRCFASIKDPAMISVCKIAVTFKARSFGYQSPMLMVLLGMLSFFVCTGMVGISRTLFKDVLWSIGSDYALCRLSYILDEILAALCDEWVGCAYGEWWKLSWEGKGVGMVKPGGSGGLVDFPRRRATDERKGVCHDIVKHSRHLLLYYWIRLPQYAVVL